MHRLALAVCLAGCTIGSIGDDPPAEVPDDSENDACGGGGGLPPPTCGQGTCSCCVGCDLGTGSCFGLDWSFDFGIGRCRATSTGSLTVDVAGIGFSATSVAAVADDAYVQVGAAAAGAALTLRVPAQLGTFDCSSIGVASFAYFDANGGEYWNRPTSPRLGCSVTLTAIGGVGGLIEGTFSVTFQVSSVTPTTLELTAGAFSVVRVAYP